MNWNHKLFFKVNSLVGKNAWLDAFGRAGAEWVIIGMGGWYLTISFILHFGNRYLMWLPIFTLGIAELFSLAISNIIGYVSKEVRPRLKFPEAKVLFFPFSSWKSFPSDHIAAAFLMFFLALIFNFPTAWSLLPLALWVGWGRVYSGVHYPLDILGGFVLSTFVALLTAAVLFYFRLI
jgi:membrane-associated phospholipid phosphatase